MEFEQLFFVVFGAFVLFLAVNVVKYRGFRGAMFGARVVRTVGEIDLGRGGLVRTRLKVHSLETHGTESPAVGVELVATSLAGFGMTPVGLTREQASSLVALLTQSMAETESTRVG